MELASILLARAIAWIEPTDLNPNGTASYPKIVSALVERYGFQNFPQKPEDFNETKGVTFTMGEFGGLVIEQLVFYTFGIALDTRSSTDESKEVLEEGLRWAGSELGLRYEPRMIKRWQYASQISFYTSVPLVRFQSPYKRLVDAVAESVAEDIGERLPYDMAVLAIDHDQLARKHALGRFSIQRRDNTPFSENKYYSDAPLPTSTHLRLLQAFEEDLSNDT